MCRQSEPGPKKLRADPVLPAPSMGMTGLPCRSQSTTRLGTVLKAFSTKPGGKDAPAGPNLVRIARAAGAPKYKGSGVLLFKKVGDRVKKGEPIFRVFSEHSRKLRDVKKLFEEELIVGIGDRREMLISHVKEEVEHKKTFILER